MDAGARLVLGGLVPHHRRGLGRDAGVIEPGRRRVARLVQADRFQLELAPLAVNATLDRGELQHPDALPLASVAGEAGKSDRAFYSSARRPTTEDGLSGDTRAPAGG